MNGFRTLIAAAMLATGFALPQAANAQLFFHNPDFHPGPIQPGDPLVGLPLPGATPKEQAANLLWNLRAGLNVAALQCQFSPYLRTVDNYNAILAHHAKELMDAYTTLGNYFKRVHGAKEGQRLFDEYSTVTYNNFSTLYGQYGFCQTAADIAKEALTRPKGKLYLTAEARLRELRNSLVPAYDRAGIYNPNLLPMPPMPPFNDDCYDRDNQLKDKCMTVASR